MSDEAGRIALRFVGTNGALLVGTAGNEGDIRVRDGAGRDVFHVNGALAELRIGTTGRAGTIKVMDDGGNTRVRVDGSEGDIILSNADCAEEFDVSTQTDVEPGTVMVLDDGGRVRPSTSAYDRRVAGVISGGGGTPPGLVLGSKRSAEGRMPLALVGTVSCKADARYSPIEVGDLLTTSATPGHAMKADDPAKAFGAVLGKALGPLKEGQGLVPILVALQ